MYAGPLTASYVLASAVAADGRDAFIAAFGRALAGAGWPRSLLLPAPGASVATCSPGALLGHPGSGDPVAGRLSNNRR